MTSPLKWHGGKHYLAAKIVALMPPHLHYVEPFAGGLSVLLAKSPDGISEVVNDLDHHLTNFWRVLASDTQFPQFLRIVQATPFSEAEFTHAVDMLRIALDPPDYVRAAWFFTVCRQSLAGRMRAFAPLSRRWVRRGMSEQAAAWLSAVEGLPEVHARLKRVVVLNRNALDVIRQQDGPDTLFYLDPPYMPETRSAPDVYAHEMTLAQHCDSLDLLRTIEGKFLLSGYRCDLYDNVAELAGWLRVDFDLPNNAAGGESKQRMTECLWLNYLPPSKS